MIWDEGSYKRFYEKSRIRYSKHFLTASLGQAPSKTQAGGGSRGIFTVKEMKIL